MTDIEQVIIEMLEPYGFKTNYPVQRNTPSYSQISIYNKTIYILEDQIKLWQWNHEQNKWLETTVDLCDPNSLQIIENWAKS